MDFGHASWGDYDNDGFLDVALAGEINGGPYCQVWRNLGSGTFTQAASIFAFVDSVAWGDFDSDGRLDLLVGPHNARVLRNTGNGTFTNMDVGLPQDLYLGTGSVAWGDYDNDGRLDILIAGDSDNVGEPITQIWRNVGDGTFTNINATLKGVSGSVAWGDYDNDGRLDVLVAGNTPWGQVTEIWRNAGAGIFLNINAGLGGAQTAAWGDYDNDGRSDVLLSSPAGSQVWRNLGSGQFSLATTLPSATAAAWGDYDNDSRLDILVDTQLLHNDAGGGTNSLPTAPIGLTSSVNGRNVSLGWSESSDATTPGPGLTYNLRVGVTSNSVEILHPSAASTGKRRLARLGNVQSSTSAIFAGGTGNYYWSIQSSDAAFAGSPFSTNGSFVIKPAATVNGLEKLSVTTATLSGTALAGTTPSSVQFFYGTNSQFNLSTAVQTIPPGPDFVRVVADLTGLLPATTYNYKLVVVTDVGTTNSSTLSFTTLAADRPTIVSVTATNLSTNSALLTATLLANQLSSSASFVWGVNGVFNNFTTPQTFNGYLPFTASALLTNLSPGQTYNFRLVVDNSAGTTDSGILTFRTPFALTSALRQPNGQVKLQFSGLAGASYTVLVSTNLSTWDVAGAATQVSPGGFEFTDTASTNQAKRFYLLRNP
jgi:hypothetical protein